MTGRRVRTALLCAAAVSATAGCRDKRANDNDPSHAAIADTATGPSARDGVWKGAEAHSTWHVTLNGPQVTQLDEIALYTDSTRAMRQFRFNGDGALVTLREERVQVVFGNKATPDTLNTLIELEWQRDSLARSSKRVNGADKMLQPYEIDYLRNHVNELLRAARTGSPATKP